MRRLQPSMRRSPSSRTTSTSGTTAATRWSKLDQAEAALDSYERVLAVNPEHVGALVNRANLLRIEGRTEEAVASYRRALALAPDDAASADQPGQRAARAAPFR